jgi:hypothetical protein
VQHRVDDAEDHVGVLVPVAFAGGAERLAWRRRDQQVAHVELERVELGDVCLQGAVSGHLARLACGVVPFDAERMDVERAESFVPASGPGEEVYGVHLTPPQLASILAI